MTTTRSVRIRRSLNGLFNWPSQFNYALTKRGLVHFDSLGPVVQRHCFAFVVQEHDTAVVTPLSNHGGPSAVRRFIVSVVVDAIKRVLAGTWPHVCVEIRERFYPSVAYANAPSTIAAVVGDVLVVAAILHRSPSSEFWRFSHAVRLATLSLSQHLKAMTTAGLGVSVAKIVRDDFRQFAAVAFAKSAKITRRITNQTYDSQLIKSLAFREFGGTHAS